MSFVEQPGMNNGPDFINNPNSFFLPKPPKDFKKSPKKIIYREDVEKVIPLGFFLGWLGVHRFKLGHIFIGLCQLSITIYSIGAPIVFLLFGEGLIALVGRGGNHYSLWEAFIFTESYIALIIAAVWGVADTIYLIVTKNKYPSRMEAQG